MSFLKNILEQLKAVQGLEEYENRDVVLNTMDMIIHRGRVDFYNELYNDMYSILNKELRKDIEVNGIDKIQTELEYRKYKFKINRMKVDLNIVNEKIAEIKDDKYDIVYRYEEHRGIKKINDMIVYLK